MSAIVQTLDSLRAGNPVTGEQIAQVLRASADRSTAQKNLFERYKGTKDGVPILKRTYPINDTSKINNKVANDFFSDIINTKIGYFAGKPIVYKYEDKDLPSVVSDDMKRNSYSDLDGETAKMAAICGFGARLCFINKDGLQSQINIPAWETVFLYDDIGVTDAEYALRFYVVQRDGKNGIYVEFYDPVNVSYWFRDGDSIQSDDPFEFEGNEPHYFKGCPVICFPNNEELQGDCEKVLSLIDGYDRTLSDVNSEIEQFRLAYMAFYGVIPDQETIDKARQTGAFGIPASATGDQGRIEFVTKNLNDVVIQNHLQQLERNIYRFAQSVDTSDQAFAANQSGVAMKYKMFALESKCISAERKFTKALYKLFDVLSGYYSKKGVSIEPLKMQFVFTRNFPLNLLDEAQTTATLRGNVSEITRVGLLSFVNDPMKELERMKQDLEDQYAMVNLENPSLLQDAETPESAAFKEFSKYAGE